jgi:FKBP-type peptidyl-prolyl cis-trans isomerase SlpA
MIQAESKVLMHFALRTSQGEEIDSTFTRRPVLLQIGDGNLLPDFEACLLGLTAGDRRVFSMLPEQAFGQPNDANVQIMKRYQFDAKMLLEPGLIVSFTDASNSKLAGVIKRVRDDEVTVDFNHPLAGMKLDFEVAIISVN